MTTKKSSNNDNKANTEEVIKNTEIEFPVTFDLKAVLDAAGSDSDNMNELDKVFVKLKIKNTYIDNKKSSKGSYISYNYKVTLLNKLQLETLYSELKNVPGLKLAI